MMDEAAAVIERSDVNSGRQARLQVFYLPLDGLNHLKCVLAGADHDYPADRFLAIPIEHATPEVRTKVHRGHISQIDGRAATRGEHDVLDVGGRTDQADTAHCHLGVIDLHHFRADVGVTSLNRFKDYAQRDVVRAQLHRVHVYLVLAKKTADRAHLRNSRHRVQLVADKPVLQGMQSARIIWTIDGVPVHLPDTGCVGAEDWCDSFRQYPRGEV